MITYCENAVKLVSINGNQVRIVIRHTGQPLSVKVEQLDEEAPGELDKALNELREEQEAFKRWYKANQ